MKSNGTTEVVIRKSIKKSAANQCPLEFVHTIQVQCSEPHAVELSKLFDLTQSDIFNRLPKCLLIKMAYANIDNRVNVLVKVKNIDGVYFDNFTSSMSQIKWKFNRNHLSLAGLLSTTEIDKRTAYYQNFGTNHLIGESDLEANLNDLHGDLKMILVDYVQVLPSGVTIFNHPSNIAKLNIFNGSGYFFTELEDSSLVKVELSDNSKQIQIEPKSMGNTQMNLYDYCAFDENHIENIQINVVGINSIHVTPNDTKVELNRNLLIKVKLTDEYGNFIKKSLFKYLNLRYTLTNDNNHATVHHIEHDEAEQQDEFADMYFFKGIKTGIEHVARGVYFPTVGNKCLRL